MGIGQLDSVEHQDKPAAPLADEILFVDVMAFAKRIAVQEGIVQHRSAVYASKGVKAPAPAPSRSGPAAFGREERVDRLSPEILRQIPTRTEDSPDAAGS